MNLPIQKTTRLAKSILLPAILLAGAAAVMWRLGVPLLVSASWLVLVGVALAIDPLGRGRFLAGVVVATLVAGLWSGMQMVETLPDQVARRLLVEFLPTAPVLLRPLVIALGLWSLVAALVVGLVRGIAVRSWRHSLLSAVGVATALGVFVYVMFVQWPDPALSTHTHRPPLGIEEIFFFEETRADLADVAEVPPRPPVPPFDVRKGLSYGPHGFRNTLDLYVPKADAKPPVVVYFHGGGVGSGGTDGTGNGLPNVWRDALLARGLAVAEINYRLGGAFPNADQPEVIGNHPAQIQDGLAAVRYLRANADRLGLNGTRIGAMGHSFGGTLASLAGVASDLPDFITDTNKGVRSEVQAVVNSAGITDHRIWAIQARMSLKMQNLPSADYVFTDKTYVDCFLSERFAGRGFDPKDPALANFSPITHVRPGKTPFLHIYGMRDCAAPPIQGDLFHGRLKKAGVPSRLVLIPGASHGLADVAGTGELMADFLAGHLIR